VERGGYAVTNYVYILSEVYEGNRLYTVGFYKPDGEWEPESDHRSTEEAAERVHWLNGGKDRDA
jgi:hypothetical protein